MKAHLDHKSHFQVLVAKLGHHIFLILDWYDYCSEWVSITNITSKQEQIRLKV